MHGKIRNHKELPGHRSPMDAVRLVFDEWIYFPVRVDALRISCLFTEDSDVKCVT